MLIPHLYPLYSKIFAEKQRIFKQPIQNLFNTTYAYYEKQINPVPDDRIGLIIGL